MYSKALRIGPSDLTPYYPITQLPDYPITLDERDFVSNKNETFDIASQHSLVFLDPRADEQSKAFRDQ